MVDIGRREHAWQIFRVPSLQHLVPIRSRSDMGELWPDLEMTRMTGSVFNPKLSQKRSRPGLPVKLLSQVPMSLEHSSLLIHAGRVRHRLTLSQRAALRKDPGIANRAASYSDSIDARFSHHSQAITRCK